MAGTRKSGKSAEKKVKKRNVRLALASKRRHYVNSHPRKTMPCIYPSKRKTCSESLNKLSDVQITVYPQRYQLPGTPQMSINTYPHNLANRAHSSNSVIVSNYSNEAHVNRVEPSFILSAFLMDHPYCQPDRESGDFKNICLDVPVPVDDVKNDFGINEELFHFDKSTASTSDVDSNTMDYSCELSLSNEVTVIENSVVNEVSDSLMTCNGNRDSDFQGLYKRLAVLPLIKSNEFILTSTDKSIQIIQLYKNVLPAVKITIDIDKDFHCSIYVHRKKINDKHSVWKGLPVKFQDEKYVGELLGRLEGMNVCEGNHETVFQDLADIYGFVSKSGVQNAYKEGDFGAVNSSGHTYSTTIRSTKCKLLLYQEAKCRHCLVYKDSMKGKAVELSYKANHQKRFNYTPYMNRFELCGKLKEQKKEINKLKLALKKSNKLFEKAKTASSGNEATFINELKILLEQQNMNEDTDVEDLSTKDEEKTDNKNQSVEPAKLLPFEDFSKDCGKEFSTTRKVQQSEEMVSVDIDERITRNGNSINASMTENADENIKSYVKTVSTWYPEPVSTLCGNNEGAGGTLKVNDSVAEECNEAMFLSNEKEQTFDTYRGNTDVSNLNRKALSSTEYEDVPNCNKVLESNAAVIPEKFVDDWRNFKWGTRKTQVNNKTKNDVTVSNSTDILIAGNNQYVSYEYQFSTLCYFCGKTYKNKDSLQDHITESHPDPDNILECPACPKKFYSKRRFKSHLRVHLIVEKKDCLTCEVCKKIFPLKASLKKHMKYMHNEGELKPFECKQCQKTFKFPHSYKEHIQSHAQSFKCDICGMNLKTKRSLGQHMMRHSADKPHTCEICGHGFIQKFSYWIHMEKHHDIRRPATSTNSKKLSGNELRQKLKNLLNSFPDNR